MPWIGVASGVIIFAVGYWILAQRALSHGHHHHDHHDRKHDKCKRQEEFEKQQEAARARPYQTDAYDYLIEQGKRPLGFESDPAKIKVHLDENRPRGQ